ncbi:trans-sulfuration enzyme family protein [Tellurirhabdus rosea]|uniref:trans-sulfuration enzyme family protein n=1 Tax=Tellurirhabdus rosea TaxID=2674997 RepID=UPI002259E29D|nr:PLP-dependent transferase [Tellurirhabdus rosea]
MNFDTLALWSTHFKDENAGAVAPPIYLTTTYEKAADGSLPHGFLYSRMNNPNREAVEKSLAALEGGALGMAFASGQAAAMVLFQALRPGDHVIVADDAYYGTPALLEEVFGPWGLLFDRVDLTNSDNLKAALRSTTRLVWVETPSNPLLKVTDLRAVTELAKSVGAATVCDNTWATPFLQKPLALGCDVVMHSTTKYFGGHSDVLSGALIFKEETELAQRVKRLQVLGGAVPSPFECWLVLRGIKTLATRVRAQTASAAQLARFLTEHPAVEAVHYPGLPTHPQHEIAKAQMTDFGAMLSVQVRGGAVEALAVAGRLKLVTHATSLGGVESLIEHRASVEGPNSTTPPNLLRVSVGLEAVEDLIEDFKEALQP